MMKDQQQANNPLHGVTLKEIVESLVAWYGWTGLGQRIKIKCFTNNPSVNSSLKFLRKTPWARDKVEKIYIVKLKKKQKQKIKRDKRINKKVIKGEL